MIAAWLALSLVSLFVAVIAAGGLAWLRSVRRHSQIVERIRAYSR